MVIEILKTIAAMIVAGTALWGIYFFEFVAVLRKSGQLTQEEIEDLFHYYLDCIENCRAVRAYIAKKGYEQLDRLLQERAQQK